MPAVGAAEVAADVELGDFEGAWWDVGALKAGAEAVFDGDEGGRAVGTRDDFVAGFGDVDLGAGDGELGRVAHLVGGLGLEALGGWPTADKGLAVSRTVE